MAVTFVSSTGLHKYVQIALLRIKCDTQTKEQMLKNLGASSVTNH